MCAALCVIKNNNNNNNNNNNSLLEIIRGQTGKEYKVRYKMQSPLFCCLRLQSLYQMVCVYFVATTVTRLLVFGFGPLRASNLCGTLFGTEANTN